MTRARPAHRDALFRAARAACLACCACVACLAGCDLVPSLDLERMKDQSKREAYEAYPFFPDGMAMRRPPEGTVPRGATLGPPAVVEGIADGRFVERVPLPVTRTRLARGRERFAIFCAPCHGLAGDGASQVAENMTLRKPPSLVDADARDFPAGRIYAAITRGYGLMRSYAADLDLDDRWAVTAYVRALQLSRAVPLDDLDRALREEAERWLR